VRRCEAGAGDAPQVPPLSQGRHHRLARRDRHQSGALRRGRGPLFRRVARRERAAVPRRALDDSATHAGVRHVAEPAAGVFQSASHPAIGRQPRFQVRAPAGDRAQVPPAVCARIPADHRVSSLRAGGSGGSGRVPLAHAAAAATGVGSGGWARAARVAAAPMTIPTPVVPVSNGFVVELEQFSGPLDLLLHLIHEDELDITNLPIAKIADQFLAVINELGLNQAADCLEMAARLLRIKAQMLVPRRLDVEGATARLQALLAERAEVGWLDVVGARPTIVDVLSVFIALLELAKRGSLSVHQAGAFTPIQIRRESPREAV